MVNDPFRRSRRFKRQRFFKRIAVLFTGTTLLCVVFILFFYIPYFQITSIPIQDAKTILQEKAALVIENFLKAKIWGILPSSNFFIFFFINNELEMRLQKEFPRIKTIHIKKRLPALATFSIEERDVWSTLCHNDSCFYSDKEGVLFGMSPHISGTVFFSIEDRRDILHALGDVFLPKEKLTRIRSLLTQLADITGDNFQSLIIEGDVLYAYEAKTNKGWRIIFDGETDIEFAAANFLSAYQGLLKENMENIDYIDLRLENKIFYKYK